MLRQLLKLNVKNVFDLANSFRDTFMKNKLLIAFLLCNTLQIFPTNHLSILQGIVATVKTESKKYGPMTKEEHDRAQRINHGTQIPHLF